MHSNVIDQLSICLECRWTQVGLESSFWLVNLSPASQVFHRGNRFWTRLVLGLLFITVENQVMDDPTLISSDTGAETAFEENVCRGFRKVANLLGVYTSITVLEIRIH